MEGRAGRQLKEELELGHVVPCNTTVQIRKHFSRKWGTWDRVSKESRDRKNEGVHHRMRRVSSKLAEVSTEWGERGIDGMGCAECENGVPGTG